MFGVPVETEAMGPLAAGAFYPSHHQIDTICVFGGARPGRDPTLARDASLLGEMIAEAGIRLVYGGGSEGLMGAVACGALRAGGQVIAITPRFLLRKIVMPAGCQVIAVPDISIRKQLMFDHADAFIALPGGIGTIEELSEVLTSRKLERHAKPVLLANFQYFWTPWLSLLAHFAEQEFINSNLTVTQLIADHPEDILPMLQRGVSFSGGYATAA